MFTLGIFFEAVSVFFFFFLHYNILLSKPCFQMPPPASFSAAQSILARPVVSITTRKNGEGAGRWTYCTSVVARGVILHEHKTLR